MNMNLRVKYYSESSSDKVENSTEKQKARLSIFLPTPHNRGRECWTPSTERSPNRVKRFGMSLGECDLPAIAESANRRIYSVSRSNQNSPFYVSIDCLGRRNTTYLFGKRKDVKNDTSNLPNLKVKKELIPEKRKTAQPIEFSVIKNTPRVRTVQISSIGQNKRKPKLKLKDLLK